MQGQIWIWATKEATWAHFTEDFTCAPARRRSTPVFEWRPKDSLVYRLYFSYYGLLTRVHDQTPNCLWERRSVVSARGLCRFRLNRHVFAQSGWYSGRMFLYGAIKGFFFFFAATHGMELPRLREGSCARASILDHRGLPLAETKCLWFQKVCWVPGKYSCCTERCKP